MHLHCSILLVRTQESNRYFGVGVDSTFCTAAAIFLNCKFAAVEICEWLSCRWIAAVGALS